MSAKGSSPLPPPGWPGCPPPPPGGSSPSPPGARPSAGIGMALKSLRISSLPPVRSLTSSRVSLRSTLFSPRITFSSISCPTVSLSSVRYKSDEFLIMTPSMPTMTSPRMRRPFSSLDVALTPARHAGPPSLASSTSTPPRPSCSTAASGAKVIPRIGRVTRPNLMIWSTIPDTMSDGSANPTPEDDPLELYIAVLIPMSRPELSRSGPPELPGLMAASVWMMPSMGRPVLPDWISRPRPLITPVVSVWSSPNGFPMAYTRCPTSRSELVPMGKGRISCVACLSPALEKSTLRTAMSLSSSKPTTFAGYTSWLANVTLTSLAPLMTW
mmetsp:Transcript_28698/g.70743  ORF Transcript_28698/g.70743 Transcript_28698/m.70743 type:complete len:327 (-) Transcript_28698:862-1842(-)